MPGRAAGAAACVSAGWPQRAVAATLLFGCTLLCAAPAQAQPADRGRAVGVLGRVRESHVSERDNVLGDLAAVPAPGWERRAAILAAGEQLGPQPSELEQTSQLADVGGLEQLRDRSSPLTQVLTSVDSYIAKIDKDISTDSAELSREKKAATPVHEVKITKSGLRVVSAAPAPIPAITAQTSATERQKILDDSARQKIQAVAHHLQQAPAAKVTSKDRFQAASDSVAADLSAAEEAIDRSCRAVTIVAENLRGAGVYVRNPVSQGA